LDRADPRPQAAEGRAHRGTAERSPERLILGTAGHIDHGKTALCRALTGIDTDRLPEEKARGITIELGFAPLDLPDGTRLGVVDVPGHEGLVRTMVAGAAGIDLLLLVVAADEGVMPQTREHLAICQLLGITDAVVALTKRDIVDAEIADLAEEEITELLAATPLAGAPILRVSSLTGEGIDALRAALAARAAATEARTPRAGPPRLPIDRSFEMRGFGPVVTGTLVGGALETGETVALLPGDRRARIRGLQCHGSAVERAEPGVRCAVNLQGVAQDDLARGLVLTRPDAVAPTRTFDARVDWLAEAPAVDDPTPVSVLSGTCERLARIAPIGAPTLAPGSSGFARIHLDAPMVLLPGDRFVLRGFARTAIGATQGGGTVLDVNPPHRRRSDPELVVELETLSHRDAETDVVVRVRRAGLAGAERGALTRETGRPPEEIAGAIAAARERGGVLVAGSRVLATDILARLEQRLLDTLDAYHLDEPLRPGMPAAALRGALPDNVPHAAAELALERLAAAGAIVAEGDHVRLAHHRPTLDPASAAAREKIVALLTDAALEAPALRDIAAHVSLGEPILRDLLAHLEREGQLVRAPGDLWFEATAVEALRERVRRHFDEHDALDTKAYKALVGTTRRTAVPLMELLDAERLTVRRGEVRKLRVSAQPASGSDGGDSQS
jgi:selenocysteine-specific elongation factor